MVIRNLLLRIMMRFLIVSASSIFLYGCQSHLSDIDDSKLDVVFDEMQDLKYVLQNYDVDLRMIEEKVLNQEVVAADVEKNVMDHYLMQQKEFEVRVQNLEGKIGNTYTSVDSLVNDVKTIKLHANQMTTTLEQYRDRFKEMEEALINQKRVMDSKLERVAVAVDSMMQVVQNHPDFRIDMGDYVVQKGDTLDRIAKKFKTSITIIKELNGLTSDLIRVGQNLKLPR